MKRTFCLVGLLLVGLSQPTESASNSTDKQNTDGSKGTTVEDLGRGLKSAAQHVEKEIPKIGSAIGNAVKKLTEKDAPEKPSSQESSKQKK
jgi:hypothetical protein